ncbi:MAG: ABC transporter permease [Armatimonadetes bacterium]|nr:ABC transporter permease [Armatimonadota bacterium]
MSLRYLDFLLQETFTGIRRNLFMSMAAVTTIAASLLLLGAVRLLTANLNILAASLGSRFEMQVFLRTDVGREERDSLGRQVSGLPGVSGCRLVPKEEALPDLCRRLDGTVDLDDLGGVNPLPDSFIVRVSDLKEMSAVAARIGRLSGVDEVKDTHQAAETWAAVTRAIQMGGTAAAALLVIAAAVIVSNTIRLTVYARRLEIGIMQLVGATSGSIRLPFLLEGMFHGFTGAVVALAALVAGYGYLHDGARHLVPLMELLPPTGSVFRAQLGALLAVGPALGLAGSYFSVRRYLHV